jgi:DUF1680 family protein
MYTAMVDLAAETGDRSYLPALNSCWQDLVKGKAYITGGAGAVAAHESFLPAYTLPNTSPDVDTCTVIGFVYWTHRMNLLQPRGKYGDFIERILYNRLPVGISLDGKRFFYGCPLVSGGSTSFDGGGSQSANRQHHRASWFGCACCPPNIVRFLASIGEYIYGHDNRSIYVNQYIGGRAKLTFHDVPVRLEQQSRYPWDGHIKLTIAPERPVAFALKLRIPAWSQEARLKVNGRMIDFQITDGFAVLDRHWKSGDVVVLELPMPVRRVKADPRVEANVGRVALQRGPVVYCLEGVDNDGEVLNLVLPKDSRLTAEYRPDLLSGVTVIQGTAQAIYADDAKRVAKAKPFLAVPFCVWDNRQPGEMIVWLPEDPQLAEAPPVAPDPGAAASQ